jgi:hypothetical protein
MKKIISVFLAAITVFALFSCNNTTGTDTETDATADGLKTCNYGKTWKDYIVISDGNDGTLIKYNVHNGEMSFLCPDPFCRHEEDCQFGGVGVLSKDYDFIENTVYYANDENGTGQNSLYSFDIDTSATKLLYESEGVIRDVRAYGRRLFIREVTGDKHSAKTRCFWYETATGKTEEYNGENTETSIKLNWIMNDRMMWYSIFTKEYFFTDLSGSIVKDYDMDYKYGNHYSRERVENEDGSAKYILYVTLEGETEKKALIDNVGQCTFAENKIIYTKPVPKDERRVAYVDELGKEFKDPYNGDIYIMNPDGSDDHLLFHCDEKIIEMADASNGLISGDYIGIYADHLLEGTGNIFVLMIVNIKTGEYIVTENLQERYARQWAEQEG